MCVITVRFADWCVRPCRRGARVYVCMCVSSCVRACECASVSVSVCCSQWHSTGKLDNTDSYTSDGGCDYGDMSGSVKGLDSQNSWVCL